MVWDDGVVDNEGMGKKKSKSMIHPIKTIGGSMRTSLTDQYVAFTTNLERLMNLPPNRTAPQTVIMITIGSGKDRNPERFLEEIHDMGEAPDQKSRRRANKVPRVMVVQATDGHGMSCTGCE